jgi:SlyX protein
LQTKIQFQEDTIQQLDQVIIDQAEKINLLTERLTLMEEKVAGLVEAQDNNVSMQQERPPHY